ncbi:MAG TPA: DUF5674 family protein [Candidatus Paceibacterota bacterium]
MQEIKILKEPITIAELKEIAAKQFGNMIKAVADVEKNLMAVGGEFHVDMQTLLSEVENSSGQNTWGINLYLNRLGEEFIEFDSMINLKPASGNRSRNVEDSKVQEKIRKIVDRLIIK